MKEIDIRGVQKTSLIDFPGKICAVLFLTKCNFRCPFCHNPELVLDEAPEQSIPVNEVLDFLKSKKKWLDGVCITGGEPTLHSGLKELIQKIKALGFLVKLDSNGSRPEIIKELLDENLLDFIAMDIKAPLNKYNLVTQAKVDLQAIQKSVDLIKNSGIDYEFRTTVVPGLFSEKDALAIGEWLKGAKKYVLQQFRPDSRTLDPEFRKIIPFPPERLKEFKKLLEPFFVKCEIRGI